MDWSHIISIIATGIFYILYIGAVGSTIVIVVLDNRNPIKTLAWILILLLFPFIGLLFYFFFGRNQRHERIIGKKHYNHLLKKPMAEYLTQEPSEIPEPYKPLVRLFQQTDQAFPFNGNHIVVYTNGYSKIQALLRYLHQARHHIHMEYYIFDNDPVGRLVKDVLIHKAKEGVEIKLLYDDVGCWHVPTRFFEEMKSAGIEVRSFLKVRFPLFTSRVNYRNHRKIVVIDGTVGFVGGMNIAQRYVKGLSWGIWRDTHILIEGKAVHGLQTAFLLDWYMVDRTLLTAKRYFPHIPTKGNATIQIVTNSPLGPWNEIMQGLVLAITNAKHYFYIQTPYFLPTTQILSAMQVAALAGIDIRLILPRRSDNRLTHLASCSYLEDVLSAGVKVYFYEKGFLHSKLMVSDDMLCTVGSTNVDFRSFEHNFEINAFIYNSRIAGEMKQVFLLDQHHSTQVFLKNWVKRPKLRKASESVVRLLAPLL